MAIQDVVFLEAVPNTIVERSCVVCRRRTVLLQFHFLVADIFPINVADYPCMPLHVRNYVLDRFPSEIRRLGLADDYRTHVHGKHFGMVNLELLREHYFMKLLACFSITSQYKVMHYVGRR